jgi:predicted outer membrane protein
MSLRFASCLLALLTACAKQEAQTPQKPQAAAHPPTSSLRYVGSSTIGQGTMPELVAEFHARTGIKFSELKDHPQT